MSERDIADTIAYATAVGRMGGTLTLEYNEGIIALSGQDLIDAAEDYEMGDGFTIREDEEPLPWELEDAEDCQTPISTSTATFLTIIGTVVGLVTVGVFVL